MTKPQPDTAKNVPHFNALNANLAPDAWSLAASLSYTVLSFFFTDESAYENETKAEILAMEVINIPLTETVKPESLYPRYS